MLGTVALILVYSAYVAGVFRAGIESVHPSPVSAARSLGLTNRQSMRLVILPQAVRRVLPPLLNDFVALLKDVGLISVLSMVDAVRAAQIVVADALDFTPHVAAGLLFVGPGGGPRSPCARGCYCSTRSPRPWTRSWSEVLAIVRELALGGITIQVADRVGFLDGGRLLESGPPAQVLGEPRHERTRQFLARVIAAGRLP